MWTSCTVQRKEWLQIISPNHWQEQNSPSSRTPSWTCPMNRVPKISKKQPIIPKICIYVTIKQHKLLPKEWNHSDIRFKSYDEILFTFFGRNQRSQNHQNSTNSLSTIIKTISEKYKNYTQRSRRSTNEETRNRTKKFDSVIEIQQNITAITNGDKKQKKHEKYKNMQYTSKNNKNLRVSRYDKMNNNGENRIQKFLTVVQQECVEYWDSLH